MQQLNYSRPDGDENQGGHDKEHEGRDHLDCSLGGLLFGALTAGSVRRESECTRKA
jgi:hypothetical protein